MASEIANAPLLMLRTINGLGGLGPFEAERLDGYQIGSTLEVTIKQRRSGKHHRWFFVFLSKLVAAGAVPYESSEHFLDALKLECGVVRMARKIGGELVEMPGSVSFAAKDQAAFKAFADKAVEVIARVYKITMEDLD